MTSEPVSLNWHFLDEVGLWTVALSAVGVIVAVFLGAVPFAVAWALAVLLDVGLVHIAAKRGGTAAERANLDRPALLIYAVARFGLKVTLILVAAFLPDTLDFWGTVVGCLAYDTVLMVVGSVLAVRRTLGSGR